MKRAGWLQRWGALAAAMLTALGCGGGEGPTTYPVTGVVTLDGKPVAGALVQFLAAADTAPGGVGGGHAQTDADGRFDVSAAVRPGQAAKRGLPAGAFRVTVSKMEAAPGPASLDNPPRNVLPAKYAAAQSTPLQAAVKADGENVVELTL